MPDGRAPIAILLYDLAGGGAERASLRLAGGLAERGECVHLVTMVDGGAFETRVPPGVERIRLGGLQAIWELPRYLARARPKALISGLDHVNIAAIAARAVSGARTPVILVVHNQIALRAKRAHLRSKVVYSLVPLAYEHADRIVAVSAGTADSAAQFLGAPRASIDVIYNAVIDDSVAAQAQEDAKHPFFAAGVPTVLGMGRLHVDKAFDVLIRAFAEVVRQRDARLIIAGEGDQRGELAELVAQLELSDKVSMPGFLTNPYAAMSASSVFALSSRHEGLAMVLIEAMFCGTPVVSTNCPSGPDEILAGGQFGTLVPVGDSAALARGILDAMDLPRDQFKERAAQFSVANAVSQYLSLIEQAGSKR